MKRFFLGMMTLLMVFGFGVYAHHDEHGMRMFWDSLPSKLHMSGAQYASFRAYLNDMHTGTMKAHKEAIGGVEKVLDKEQFQHFMMDLKHMHRFLKNDQEVEAAVDKESKRLLITANQSAQMEVIAKTFYHKQWQLMKTFSTRLNRVLSKSQQEKYEQIMSKCM